MLVSAAVCPHPPSLIPDLAGAAQDALARVREAALAATDRLCRTAPDLLVIVGAGGVSRRHEVGCVGSLDGFGLNRRIALGHDAGRPAELPLSLTVAAWLLEATNPPACLAQEIAAGTSAEQCASIGAALAGMGERVAMLVMGDGSACRSATAPGFFDPRAAAFDEQAAHALASGEPRHLLALDAGLATALMVAGRASWQVLAGAARESDALGRAGDSAEPTRWEAEVLIRDDPFGVDYVVAEWRLR